MSDPITPTMDDLYKKNSDYNDNEGKKGPAKRLSMNEAPAY